MAHIKKNTVKRLGFGSIDFISATLAANVVNAANGANGIFIQGRKIHLEWAVGHSSWSKLKKHEELREEIYEITVPEEGQYHLPLFFRSLTFALQSIQRRQHLIPLSRTPISTTLSPISKSNRNQDEGEARLSLRGQV